MITCDDIYHHMQLEFANQPAIIVDRKTQYLSRHLHFYGGNTASPRLLIKVYLARVNKCVY